MLAVLFGAAAAALCAAAWAAIAVWTGYEIGWLAVGFGFVVGFAVRMSRMEGPGAAAIALLFVLVGFAGAKVLSVNWSLESGKFAEQLLVDDETFFLPIMAEMARQGELPPEVAEVIATID